MCKLLQEMHKLISHDNGFLDMSMSVSSNVQLVLVAYMFCSLSYTRRCTSMLGMRSKTPVHWTVTVTQTQTVIHLMNSQMKTVCLRIVMWYVLVNVRSHWYWTFWLSFTCVYSGQHLIQINDQSFGSVLLVFTADSI